MPFAIPIVWREGKGCVKNCYFCMMNIQRISYKNKHHVQYPDVPSAKRPISHDPDFPIPKPDGNIEYSSYSDYSDMTIVSGDGTHKPEDNNQQVPLTQAEFNNLTQNLNFSKESAQLLGSHLKKKHLFAQWCYWYQDNERELRKFSHSRISDHWFTATTLLDWSNQWAKSMMRQNGDFLLTHPAEVTK